jgi:hypothetical protein
LIGAVATAEGDAGVNPEGKTMGKDVVIARDEAVILFLPV